MKMTVIVLAAITFPLRVSYLRKARTLNFMNSQGYQTQLAASRKAYAVAAQSATKTSHASQKPLAEMNSLLQRRNSGRDVRLFLLHFPRRGDRAFVSKQSAISLAPSSSYPRRGACFT